MLLLLLSRVEHPSCCCCCCCLEDVVAMTTVQGQQRRRPNIDETIKRRQQQQQQHATCYPATSLSDRRLRSSTERPGSPARPVGQSVSRALPGRADNVVDSTRLDLFRLPPSIFCMAPNSTWFDSSLCNTPYCATRFTTDPQQIESQQPMRTTSCTTQARIKSKACNKYTASQHVKMVYDLLSNKSSTNRSSGVTALHHPTLPTLGCFLYSARAAAN